MSTIQDPASSSPVEEWGPTVRGGRRRRGRGALRVLLVVVVLVAGYGFALGVRASTSIGRVDVPGLSGHSGGPLNFLVVGSDSREDLSEEEQNELAAGYVEGERTDSIFLLSVEGGRAGMLAFPRDLYVTRCDGSTGRINAAFSAGGPSCLVDTVEAVSGLPVHHFVSVSFGGFRDLVDAVGGVHICVDKDLDDPWAGVNLKAGCQTLSGAQALGYVRTRKLDSDLERIKRQQQFVAALADQVATPATFVNPVEAWRTTGAVGNALTADGGLGLWRLARLGFGLRGLAGGNAVTATVPASPATIGGAAVLQIDEAAAGPLFASFRDGSILQQDGGVARTDVRVRVLNGAGVSGLAGRTADELAELGYQIAGIGDAEPHDTTVIRFDPSQRDRAELLGRDLPVAAALEEDPGAASLTLVLGTDLTNGLG